MKNTEKAGSARRRHSYLRQDVHLSPERNRADSFCAQLDGRQARHSHSRRQRDQGPPPRTRRVVGRMSPDCRADVTACRVATLLTQSRSRPWAPPPRTGLSTRERADDRDVDKALAGSGVILAVSGAHARVCRITGSPTHRLRPPLSLCRRRAHLHVRRPPGRLMAATPSRSPHGPRFSSARPRKPQRPCFEPRPRAYAKSFGRQPPRYLSASSSRSDSPSGPAAFNASMWASNVSSPP